MSKERSRLCLVLLLTVLALSLNILGVAYNVAYAAPCPKDLTYTLSTTDEQSSNPTWKTSYSANSTYDIYFALDIQARKKTVQDYFNTAHGLTLEVVTPSGFPYQRFDRLLTDTSGEAVVCGRRNWESMPVAGTFIQQFQIYGTWIANAYVDGILVATTSFEIVP